MIDIRNMGSGEIREAQQQIRSGEHPYYTAVDLDVVVELLLELQKRNEEKALRLRRTLCYDPHVGSWTS